MKPMPPQRQIIHAKREIHSSVSLKFMQAGHGHLIRLEGLRPSRHLPLKGKAAAACNSCESATPIRRYILSFISFSSFASNSS